MKAFALTISALLALSVGSQCFADDVATVETSGLVFKDTLTVHAFEDPTLTGVSCYVTLQNRALSFENASDTSISCVQTGKITGDLSNRENIFTQSKNLWFKVMRVDRFYDAPRHALVYLAYTTSTSAKNHAHAMSVVVVNPQ